MWRVIKKSLYTVYKAGDNLVEHDGIELAGYMTFLSLLALFPFLVLIVATAGFVGQGEAGTQLIELIITHLPEQAVSSIRPRIDEIMSGPPQGLLTVSILGAIWTSSSAVEGMRTVLNRAYQVSSPPTYILRRLMSILQLILFTIMIIIVMSVIVLSPILFPQLQPTMGPHQPDDPVAIWNRYFIYIGGFILFLLVASLYYFLPNIKQRLLSVVPGAALVVILWIGGASLFTFYINTVDQVNIIYGSLGGFIATLLFFFIQNVIFIYGAEFNHMIIEALGRPVQEKEHVEEEESEDIELTDSHTRQSSQPEKNKE